MLGRNALTKHDNLGRLVLGPNVYMVLVLHNGNSVFGSHHDVWAVRNRNGVMVRLERRNFFWGLHAN
jgi:hypothetical protein